MGTISVFNPSTVIPFPWSQQTSPVMHLSNSPHHAFSRTQTLTVSFEHLTEECSFLLCDTTLFNLIAKDLWWECYPDGLFLPVWEVLVNLDINLPVLLCVDEAQIEALSWAKSSPIFYLFYWSQTHQVSIRLTHPN